MVNGRVLGVYVTRFARQLGRWGFEVGVEKVAYKEGDVGFGYTVEYAVPELLDGHRHFRQRWDITSCAGGVKVYNYIGGHFDKVFYDVELLKNFFDFALIEALEVAQNCSLPEVIISGGDKKMFYLTWKPAYALVTVEGTIRYLQGVQQGCALICRVLGIGVPAYIVRNDRYSEMSIRMDARHRKALRELSNVYPYIRGVF